LHIKEILTQHNLIYPPTADIRIYQIEARFIYRVSFLKEIEFEPVLRGSPLPPNDVSAEATGDHRDYQRPKSRKICSPMRIARRDQIAFLAVGGRFF